MQSIWIDMVKARASWAEQDYRTADEHATRSLDAAHRHNPGDTHSLGYALILKSEIDVALGQFDVAESRARQAYQIFLELGLLNATDALEALCEVALADGRFDEAETAMRRYGDLWSTRHSAPPAMLPCRLSQVLAEQ